MCKCRHVLDVHGVARVWLLFLRSRAETPPIPLPMTSPWRTVQFACIPPLSKACSTETEKERGERGKPSDYNSLACWIFLGRKHDDGPNTGSHERLKTWAKRNLVETSRCEVARSTKGLFSLLIHSELLRRCDRVALVSTSASAKDLVVDRFPASFIGKTPSNYKMADDSYP